MSPHLPPPDPLEPGGLPPGRMQVPAPVALFLGGSPSPEVDRAADTILKARPGLLFVCLR